MAPTLCPRGIHDTFNEVPSGGPPHPPPHAHTLLVFPLGISFPLFLLGLPSKSFSDGFYSYKNRCVFVAGGGEMGIMV